ncbi:hypothetical protein B0H11DRAFT_1916988 [Mycena galericulata]|nr:hypothetical protein B0H11DRAFT_1916988 [Mycena galericulata]
MAAVGGSVGGNKWRQSDTYGHPVPRLGFSVIYTFPTYLAVNYTSSSRKKRRVHGHILVNFRLSWRQLAAVYLLGGGNVADTKLFWAAVGVIGGSAGGSGRRQCGRHSRLEGGRWRQFPTLAVVAAVTYRSTYTAPNVPYWRQTSSGFY